MAFALAPLGVYYGRAFQAEALLVLCAPGALEAHSIWVERRMGTDYELDLLRRSSIDQSNSLALAGPALLLVQLTLRLKRRLNL